MRTRCLWHFDIQLCDEEIAFTKKTNEGELKRQQGQGLRSTEQKEGEGSKRCVFMRMIFDIKIICAKSFM